MFGPPPPPGSLYAPPPSPAVLSALEAREREARAVPLPPSELLLPPDFHQHQHTHAHTHLHVHPGEAGPVPPRPVPAGRPAALLRGTAGPGESAPAEASPAVTSLTGCYTAARPNFGAFSDIGLHETQLWPKKVHLDFRSGSCLDKGSVVRGTHIAATRAHCSVQYGFIRCVVARYESKPSWKLFWMKVMTFVAQIRSFFACGLRIRMASN